MNAAVRQGIVRKTALLLALICLWISAGATLVHTDDLSELRSFAAAGRSAALGHALPFAPPHECAACAWESGCLSAALAAFALAAVLLSLPGGVLATPRPWPLVHFDSSARAPPLS